MKYKYSKFKHSSLKILLNLDSESFITDCKPSIANNMMVTHENNG